MRATILTSEFPPYIYGGVGVHLRYLTEAFRDAAFVGERGPVELDVRYLGKEAREDAGLRLTPFAPWDVAEGADDPKLAKALGPLSANVGMVARRIEADIVHAHTWYAFFAGHLARLLYGVPLVVTVHSLEPKRPWKGEQLGRGYALSSWMERQGIESADRVIAVSGEMRRDILSLFPVDPEKVVVVHNGIDLDRYRAAAEVDVRAMYGIRGPFALFVGRLSRQKGIDVLLRAAPKLADGLTIVMAATSPDTPDLLREVEKATDGNRRIVWINRMLPEDQLIALYTEADIFVCPSVYEPFGIINLEAMACRTPVVASAVGGIPEVVVDGETGTLVPPSDPDALAAAVNRLVGDPALRERYRAAGRRRVEEHFSWKTIARRTHDVYRAAIAAHAAGGGK